VRQVDHPQHLAENQFADIGIDVARDVSRQALDFNLAQHLLENAALLFDAGRFTLQQDRYLDRQLPVHGDCASGRTWSSLPFTGSYCQSTIMALVCSPPFRARSKIVLCPVSEPRIRETCRGSTLTGSASFPGPVEDSGIFAAAAHPPGFVLVACGAGLRFEKIVFDCGCHTFDSCLHE